jgi:hypothetical protein
MLLLCWRGTGGFDYCVLWSLLKIEGSFLNGLAYTIFFINYYYIYSYINIRGIATDRRLAQRIDATRWWWRATTSLAVLQGDGGEPSAQTGAFTYILIAFM